MASSAGILMYRQTGDRLQVLLVHPGGPFWLNKDKGAWSIPKGEMAALGDNRPRGLEQFLVDLEYRREGDTCGHPGGAQYADAARRARPHPAIEPRSLRLSGGYIGAKRMLWFMAHQAEAVSRDRKLGISFQVLVPTQAMAGTELGHAVAAACAQAEGVTIDEYMLKRYGPTLHPSQIGRQVAEVLVEPRYKTGIAYGFRANVDLIPLDQ